MTGLSSSCGACKFLRRKCTNQCVFAPYFSYDEAASHFAAVHKVFGASNVSKLLLHLPLHNRNDAAISIAYEALERMRDPTYGCVAHIFALQKEVASLQVEIEILGNQIANFGAGSGSFRPEAKNPINIEFQQLHESIMNIDNYQNQLNPELLYQTFNGQTDTQISPSSFALGDQDQLLGACNLVGESPFDVVGMALENFACYPWWENTV